MIPFSFNKKEKRKWASVKLTIKVSTFVLTLSQKTDTLIIRNGLVCWDSRRGFFLIKNKVNDNLPGQIRDNFNSNMPQTNVQGM